jgi:hypothetical protein
VDFSPHQLGRFGSYCRERWPEEEAPDILAARTIASGRRGRPNLADLLAGRGFLLPHDPSWKKWERAFNKMVLASGLHPLQTHAPCPTPLEKSASICPHAFTTPATFGTLRSPFWHKLPENVLLNIAPIRVNQTVKPARIFVITENGEILLGLEDFGWFKHPSLAGGGAVWAAGEFGQQGGKLCVVDLHSGHYIGRRELRHIEPSSSRVSLTNQIFRSYCSLFRVELHADFHVFTD